MTRARLLMVFLSTVAIGCGGNIGGGGDDDGGGRDGGGGGGADARPIDQRADAMPINTDCTDADVLCVGSGLEYTTIQAAVDEVAAGQLVLVHDGTYDGFKVSTSGTEGNPVHIRALAGGALVNTVPAGNEGDVIYISNASHVIIEGFEVTGATVYGISTHDASAANPMVGVVIRGNTAHGAGKENIYISHTANSLIEGNELYDAAFHGLYLSNAGTDGTIVRGNHIHDNGNSGIHFNGDMSQGGDGVQSGLVIEENRIHNNIANALNMDGVKDSLIRNNLFYENGRHAVRGYDEDASEGPSNMRVVNNSMDANTGTAVKFTQDGGGHVIFNNILLSVEASVSLESSNGVTCDYNVVFDGTCTGPNNIQSSAALVYQNADGDIYTLASTSPAKNAGTNQAGGVTAPSIDINGAARPQGTGYDIGAHEAAE